MQRDGRCPGALSDRLLLAWQGATVLYVQYISPLIRKHESQIDNALEEGMKRSDLALERARGLGIFRGGSGTDGMAPSKAMSES